MPKNREEIAADIHQVFLTYNKDELWSKVNEALEQKHDAEFILNECLTPSLRKLGVLFERGEVFIPHLVVAAEMVEQTVAKLLPYMPAGQTQKKARVVIGTVAGDIHDLGKNLVGTMLSVSGYEVFDLGKDVPIDRFIQEVKEKEPQFIGMSALMTTTMVNQKGVIDALKGHGLREGVKVLVGGAPASRGWMEEIGADGYAQDAIRAVRVVDGLLGN
jgi:dimethylamine corrinoid protein